MVLVIDCSAIVGLACILGASQSRSSLVHFLPIRLIKILHISTGCEAQLLDKCITTPISPPSCMLGCEWDILGYCSAAGVGFDDPLWYDVLNQPGNYRSS